MTTLITVSFMFVLLVGVTVKRVTDWLDTDTDITLIEFGVVSAIAAFVIIPLVVFLGWHSALNNMVKYHEFWNGWEKRALVSHTDCHKDGGCTFTYECDPYTYTWTVTDYSTDANGNTYVSGSHEESETRYHDCPYVTREYTYDIETTLGSYSVGGVRWAENPTSWSGDGSDDRDSTPNVPRGAPKLWQAAHDRIAHGDNGPVTKPADYDNFLLASQSTILKQYSDSIVKYQKAHLMPKVPTKVENYYFADKVHAEHVTVAEDQWRQDLARFDAALGTDLQGDMEVVLVPLTEADADNYTLSLKAYWGSPALGKYDISKNGIVLVLGTTDDATIAWARAFTGMPVGNNAMLKDMESAVVGKPLDSALLFGHPTVDLSGKKPKTTHTHGIVEDIVFGPNHFQRVCMGCEGKGDKGVGYLYLKNELQPGKGARFWTCFIAIFLSTLLWVAALLIGTRARPGHQRRTITPW